MVSESLLNRTRLQQNALRNGKKKCSNGLQNLRRKTR
nr:MAG TPA: hypothetical protein [Bacteriophage sp.]